MDLTGLHKRGEGSGNQLEITQTEVDCKITECFCLYQRVLFPIRRQREHKKDEVTRAKSSFSLSAVLSRV